MGVGRRWEGWNKNLWGTVPPDVGQKRHQKMMMSRDAVSSQALKMLGVEVGCIMQIVDFISTPVIMEVVSPQGMITHCRRKNNKADRMGDNNKGDVIDSRNRC